VRLSKTCGPKNLPKDEPSKRRSARQASRPASAASDLLRFDLDRCLLDQVLPYVPEELRIKFAKKLARELDKYLRHHMQSPSDEDIMSEEMEELSLNEPPHLPLGAIEEVDCGPYGGSEVHQFFNSQSLLSANSAAVLPLIPLFPLSVQVCS